MKVVSGPIQRGDLQREHTIMECPAAESNLQHVEPVFPLSRRPVLILPLHPHEIESQSEDPDDQAD